MVKLTKRNKKRNMYKNKKRNTYKKKYRQTQKRNGGMLRTFGSAVKTVGTEYVKDQAQRVFAGKQNVFKTFDANSPENKFIKRNYQISQNDENNSENINPNINKNNSENINPNKNKNIILDIKNIVKPIQKLPTYDMEI